MYSMSSESASSVAPRKRGTRAEPSIRIPFSPPEIERVSDDLGLLSNSLPGYLTLPNDDDPDLKSYLEADQRLLDLSREPKAWATKAILNVANSGKFSSDRTIAEYASEIWNVQPCPVS